MNRRTLIKGMLGAVVAFPFISLAKEVPKKQSSWKQYAWVWNEDLTAIVDLKEIPERGTSAFWGDVELSGALASDSFIELSNKQGRT